MDYKVNNLFKKIYKNFITGVYGRPRIPEKNEVIKKMEELTTQEYIPVTKADLLTDIDIVAIKEKYNNIIDDLDILFGAIENESVDILDQLTASLKEFNITKRELRRIKISNQDINTGKMGEEFLNYNFTENFDTVSNVNTVLSDPVDTNAGIFTIKSVSNKVLTLNHYKGRKLDFNLIEYYSRIVSQGYVGSTDAAGILDQQDPRHIAYIVKTSKPTKLRIATTLQLLPDGKNIEINSVALDLDSSVSKGYVRLYYREGTNWVDVPTFNIKEIKSNKVIFTFANVQTSHIKIEFIKDTPDSFSTNEYIFIINNIAIYLGKSQNKATLYSKGIIVKDYNNEVPVINNIKAIVDAQVPSECSVKLSIAPDIKISGQFYDSYGIAVDASSSSAVSFDSNTNGFVYLSDILGKEDVISGLEPYKVMDFLWRDLKTSYSIDKKADDIVEFQTCNTKEQILNTIYSSSSPTYYWGDQNYAGPWPQDSGYGPFITGWCNEDNPLWSSYLAGMVYSGMAFYGPTITGYDPIEDSSGNLNPGILADPNYVGQWLGYASGYPWNYTNPNTGLTFKWGESVLDVYGWWRPAAEQLTPTGIMNDFKANPNTIDNPDTNDNTLESGSIKAYPDFYFNGVEFYKVYKFSSLNQVIDPTIRFYNYEERPVIGDNRYYPHNFDWNYKSSWEMKVDTKRNLSVRSGTDYTIDGPVAQTFDNSYVRFELLNNEEYILDGVEKVRVTNTNLVLNGENNTDYYVIYSGALCAIKLDPLDTNQPMLEPNNITLDVTYRYKVKNKYSSTWTGYAIISPFVSNPKLYISNFKNDNNEDILGGVTCEDLETGEVKEYKTTQNNKFEISFGSSSATGSNRHFKIVIQCISDEETGFSAKIANSNNSSWIPITDHLGYAGTMNMTPGIKLVSKLSPITLVSLSSLIYDTPSNINDKCAIYTDRLNDKYLVAKKPSKDIFPGYYYSSIDKVYETIPEEQISNIGHYIRYGVYGEGVNSTGILYTTGSSGTMILNISGTEDLTWNEGKTLPQYPNSLVDINFPLHTTYNSPLHIDDIDTSGYLYYNTAENLPAYYSISYKYANSTDNSISRFVYKLVLESNDSNNRVPQVNTVRFSINNEVL